MDMSVKDDAYRYAVKNAFEHDGNANVQAVIGKIIALHKGIAVKDVIKDIQGAVGKANSLSKEELESEFQKFDAQGFELKKPEEKEKTLPELEWAEVEPVVTRFAPNPNGPIHFGHARAAILSHEYARKYNGKFLLRFDDTDPKVKKSMKNAKEIFLKDLKWMGINVDTIYFASDRLELYYNHLQQLLQQGQAYVCNCSSEKWQGYARKKKACPERNRTPEENLQLFENMLNHTIKEGKAIVRIKTDLQHPDPSIRDWWACRIVDKPNHPRVKGKYHVWPSYMFQSAIDDHVLRVTLMLRGQEHAQNETKQKFVYDYFGWIYPHTIHFGRLKLGDMVLSTSTIAAGITQKKFSGWDDPRIGTISALRRRGIQAEAIKQAMLQVGVKTSDANISPEKLHDINRGIVEKKADRIPFVRDAVKLTVQDTPKMKVDIDGKQYTLKKGKEVFWVSKKELKGRKEIRLRNSYNVYITNGGATSAQARYTSTEMKKLPVISWVQNGLKVSVKTPTNSAEQGIADARLGKKKPDSIVYLEKYGFCRVDAVKKTRVSLYYTHE
jgi:glutamyl-tRNA synthetase